jgi:hypothetical protein
MVAVPSCHHSNTIASSCPQNPVKNAYLKNHLFDQEKFGQLFIGLKELLGHKALTLELKYFSCARQVQHFSGWFLTPERIYSGSHSSEVHADSCNTCTVRFSMYCIRTGTTIYRQAGQACRLQD